MNAGDVNHAFAYDANGNTTTDGLNALNLDYNFLNLTKQVRQGNTVKANYAWTGEGGKRSAVNGAGNGGYEYLGSLVYQRNGSVLTLESAGFSGGLITPSETQYYLVDHLGSTRVVVNSSGTELARYDYDPFGQATTPTGLLSSNRYLFQGKESQNAFGIPYNDHGWRMYDPKRGGWGTQDALYQYASPYTFCGNNPLNFIDPTGLWSEDPDRIYELFDIGSGILLKGNYTSYKIEQFHLKRRQGWNLQANYILSAFIEDGGGYEGGGTRKYRLTEHGRRIEELSLTEVQNLIRDLNPAIQAVHKAQAAFGRAALGAISQGLNVIGWGLTTVGQIATFAGMPVGLGLMAVGSGFNLISTGINALMDLNDGNYGRVLVSVGTSAAFYGLSNFYSLNQIPNNYFKPGNGVQVSGLGTPSLIVNTLGFGTDLIINRSR